MREHYGAGRLSESELSERVEQVYGARTIPELEALTLDLPTAGEAIPAAGPPVPAALRSLTPVGRGLRLSFNVHVTLYLLINLMLIGIWAASGGGYF